MNNFNIHIAVIALDPIKFQSAPILFILIVMLPQPRILFMIFFFKQETFD